MNILMMTLLYPEDSWEEVNRSVRDKIQNQINNHQRALEAGIRLHLRDGETLTLLNSLPVGIYPMQYRRLILKAGMHDAGTIHQLGCVNLPWFKQRMRRAGALHELEAWCAQSPDNRTVLLYTQYLPYVQAVAQAKKRFPDLKAVVIVTDLPNELGLPTGRKGLLKKLEYRLGRQSLALLAQMDGFVLLTEPMAEALHLTQPYIVMEGIVQPDRGDGPDAPPSEKPAVLYTGTLEPDLGIGDLLKAFQNMPEFELWICGTGTMQDAVRESAQKSPNIRYFGFVPQKEALAHQARASALINPRAPGGVFTRYSFPSKTLEYLRSGKPVLCYPLEGIPHDYDPYLRYIATPAGAESIADAVRTLLSLPAAERAQMGEKGRAFVLTQKTPSVQCEKLMRLLRQL